MINDPVTAIVVIAIVIFFSGLVVFLILRKMKGTIVLKTDEQVYSLGEKLSGSVEVIARGSVEVNSFVLSLVCEEYYRAGRRSESRSQTVKLVDIKCDLEMSGKKLFGKEVRAFSLDIPKEIKKNPASEDLLIAKIGAIVGEMIKGEIKWYLYAHLDCKGIDLLAKKSIHVNL